MLNQSFKQVFVTNNPTLLASGQTVENLAVGQIAILDGKTYVSTTSPTYAKNKALFVVHGTPDMSGGPLMDGQYDQNEYSKRIIGKTITAFRGKAAKRGQHQIITIGNSGSVSDTDTISAKNGEQRHLYITLTGTPIDKLFSMQGITRHYIAEFPIDSDCTDICASVDPRFVADEFIKQINTDTMINRLVRASRIEQCDTPVTYTTQSVYKFQLRVADAQDDVALGYVQSQYPSDVVTRIGVEGIISVYEIQNTTGSTPAAFSNDDITVITNCDVCPSGYTKTAGGFVYEIKRADAGTSGANDTVKTDYGISGSAESSTRVNYEGGVSTYIIVSGTAINAAVGVDDYRFVGESRGTCVITTPGTFDWGNVGTLTQYGKVYRITLADDECGENRLADLQAALPSYVISVVDASGTCVHTYETTVYSNPVDDTCSYNSVQFVAPPAFEGSPWVAVEPTVDGTGCLVGIRLETAFVNRVTNDCTFDYFPYESEAVFVTASTFDPVYNDSPFAHADWVVKNIQSVQFPQGFGAHIRELEKKSLDYALKTRSFDPVLRESQGFSFQAIPYRYYDEYQLDFEYSVMVGGWAQRETYKYTLIVYFPEGNGKAFETAVNGYLASANINIDPVVL